MPIKQNLSSSEYLICLDEERDDGNGDGDDDGDNKLYFGNI